MTEAELTPTQMLAARLVAAGATETEAAQRMGVSDRTLRRRLEEVKRQLGARTMAQAVAILAADGVIDPRQSVPEPELRLLSEQRELRAIQWREPLLNLVRSGVTISDGCRYLGVSRAQVVHHLSAHPDQNARYAAAREEFMADAPTLVGQRRHPPPRSASQIAALTHLINGTTLREACDKAAIPVPTMKRMRRRDPLWDHSIVTAAALGGSRLQLYAPLACPGPLCGTTTGYDYGCREASCRTKKTTAITNRRRRT